MTKGLTRVRRGESVSNVSSKPNGYNEGIRYQGKQCKKHTLSQLPEIASCLQGGFKGAYAPSRDIFIYRVEKDTPDDVIKVYIVTYGIKLRSVERVSSENATFNSFRVEISV